MIRHETQRLILRDLNLDDAPFMLELMNEPGWLRFVGDRGIRTVEDASTYLRTKPMQCYLDHGFGPLLVVERETSEPVGICGLVARDTLDHPDLGFAISERFAGRGYATESGAVVLEHAATVREMKRVLAICTEDHAASIRVLEKLGFRFEEVVKLEGEGVPLRRYAWGG